MKCFAENLSECFSLISTPSVKIGVGLFLYGVYTVLYTLCIYILATRKRNRYCVQVMLITVLYVAATAEVGLKLAIYTSEAQLYMAYYNSYLTNYMEVDSQE
ncbi:hypothetical protein PQX77_012750 [Marasmius sp. AFHP31]|nr:hypothetical protein PQX77_012750 [Marasmius sp. AFHP31]